MSTGRNRRPTCAASVCSCSIAAGTIDVGARPAAPSSSCARCRSRASLPPVVVLPAPCRPASRITAGGCVGEVERRRCAAHQRGRARGARRRSAPGPASATADDFLRRAPSRCTRAMKSLARPAARRRLRAARGALRAARPGCSSSVSRASPRSVLTTRDRRSVRLSSMGIAKASAVGAARGVAARLR